MPLPPWIGHKPKREFSNSCAPCLQLKRDVRCQSYCCRSTFVVLAQEDLDDGLATASPFVDVLAYAPNGPCVYFDLDTEQCGVWESRPLDCRLYDCRADGRVQRLGYRSVARPAPQAPDRCPCCGRDLHLLAGAQDLCDGYATCIECGAPFRFRAGVVSFAGEPATTRRREYLLASYVYRRMWPESVALGEELCAETPYRVDLTLRLAIAYAHVDRIEDARCLLEPLVGDHVALSTHLAWLHSQAGEAEAARSTLEAALDRLPTSMRPTAHVQLGQIARAAGDAEAAAGHFAAAIESGLRDPSTRGLVAREKEYLLEMLREDDAELRAAANCQHERLLAQVPGYFG